MSLPRYAHLVLGLFAKPELLVLAVGKHLVELIEKDGVRLDALVIVYSLRFGVRWSV